MTLILVRCSNNSTINNPQTLFHHIRDRHSTPTQGFPANGEGLSNLTRAEFTKFLRAYDLSTDGSVDEKKKRLGQFIGIVSDKGWPNLVSASRTSCIVIITLNLEVSHHRPRYCGASLLGTEMEFKG